MIKPSILDDLSDNVTHFQETPELSWEEIQPLPDSLKPVELFNLDLLPEAFKPWIADISSRMQCPPDYPAIGAMVSLSAVIGRKIGIFPKAQDDWLVVPNLWGVAIGRPSMMKTPALDEAIKPLKTLEIEAKQAFDNALTDFEVTAELLDLQKKDARKKAQAEINKKNHSKARDLLADSELLLPGEPTRKRFIVNDATVEKLGELCNENPNGLLLFRDELSGWLRTIDREDHSNDRSFYLQAFDGKGRYTYDRIGRGTLDIEATTVSVLGGIQPAKLRPYISSSIKGGQHDDGLLQRLQLMVYPDVKKAWNYIDRFPNSDAKKVAFSVFKIIADKMVFPEPDEGQDIPGLRFTESAQKVFIEWLTDLEAEIRSEDIHPAIESHLTKYRSLMPSLALVIHIAEAAQEVLDFEDSSQTIDQLMNKIQVGIKPLPPVSDAALIRACAWGEYLKTHVERVYGLAIETEIHALKQILGKAKSGQLTNPFSIRELRRKQWSGLTDQVIIEQAVKLGLDEGYFKEHVNKTSTRSSIVYHIHPDLAGGGHE